MKGWGIWICSILLAQEASLPEADSLWNVGAYGPALDAYARVISEAAEDSLRLKAYLGAAQAAMELGEDSLALLYATEGQSLASRLRNPALSAALLAVQATAYTNQALYERADSLYAQAQTLYSQIGLLQSPERASLLRQIGDLRVFQGRFSEAESLYVLSLTLYRGQSSPSLGLILLLNSLGALYYDTGRFSEAEAAYLEAQALQAELLPLSHPTRWGVLNNLAALYMEQGRLEAADSLLLQVREAWSGLLGPQHPYTLSATNNLALLRSYRGRYPESEKLLREVVSLRARTLGTYHPDYLISAANLAYVILQLGRPEEAKALLTEIAQAWAEVGDPSHPHRLEVLIYLADALSYTKEIAAAESLNLQIKDLVAQVWGTESLVYLSSLLRTAQALVQSKKLSEAEALVTEAMSLLEQRAKACDLFYPNALYLSARISQLKKDLAQAQQQAEKASGVIQSCPEVPLHTRVPLLSLLAELYRERKAYPNADSLYFEIARAVLSYIQRELYAVPASRREKFLEQVPYAFLNELQQYVAERAADSPAITELGYRVGRSFKGLLLGSVEGMKYLIEERYGGDTLLQSLYREWKQLVELQVFYTLHEQQGAADSALRLAVQVEEALLERLPELKRYFPDLYGEPLIPPLRPKEALIEVIRTPLEGDSVLYLFYLLTPARKGHQLRLYTHRTTSAWESRALRAYEIVRAPDALLTGTAYKLLWEPIEKLLPKGVQALYFSPDGIYYRINIAALYDVKQKEFLGDRYIVRYIASSRRLFLRASGGQKRPPAVIGNPQFYATPIQGSSNAPRQKVLFTGGIPSLPAAEEEARGIAQILGVEPVIGEKATEAFVKSLKSPRILHIATHGYFLEEAKNPMLSGGILLAQAALWDSLYAPFGVEDGRLTAQEASTLNLLGTELVVLSACETALGTVKGEGLYGLQRGFLEAGAQRVMAALWPVDDAATRELMEAFYRRWQANPKLAPEEAFSGVLKTFRQKYPQPYYWGAFVVMQ